MDFRQLQYICMVAETKSITKAATALYISQPSLSHFIAKTEEELGVSLFDRSTTPISLTYAGEKYVQTAHKILALNEQMQKEFRDISKNMKGRLRIGLPHDRAAYMLPMIVPAFNREFPGIEVQIYTAPSKGLLDALYRGLANIVILPCGEPQEKKLESFTICREEMLVVAGKGAISSDCLIGGQGNTVDLARIVDYPFLLLQQGHASRTMIDALFQACGMMPRIRLETNSNITSYRLAASGMGITIVPGMITKLVRHDPDAQLYSIYPGPVMWEVRALYLRDSYMGVAEHRFLEIARNVLSER
ncbi:MAG TPA: LysR family transcriptional regulator [Clostridia bacterium]|nr:LysR family transcriptional regulator [Clostridia bacterium]